MMSNETKERTTSLLKDSICLRTITSVSLLFLFIFAVVSTATAQDDDDQEHIAQTDIAPPPLRIVSRDELTKLDRQKDLRSRTRLSVDLMNSRLKAAESRSSEADFDGVFRELGFFHGLMNNGYEFLEENNTGQRRALDNFKRFEIALRGFIPRLETIRRELPVKYDDYVRKLMRYVRDTRSKTVEPLFGETVIRPPEERPNQEPR